MQDNHAAVASTSVEVAPKQHVDKLESPTFFRESEAIGLI